MDEFTYMVFVVISSMIGVLLTLFVAIIATALLHDGDGSAHAVVEPLLDAPEHRQAA
jgi:hypothetical protein